MAAAPQLIGLASAVVGALAAAGVFDKKQKKLKVPTREDPEVEEARRRALVRNRRRRGLASTRLVGASEGGGPQINRPLLGGTGRPGGPQPQAGRL